ncbi:MAG: hypothetical protein EOP56_13280 [Sphingobacteriales bacterium]|nr:MAG: hypothetical protein EOP56_13280 [Sphingobacteriales bacterium]
MTISDGHHHSPYEQRKRKDIFFFTASVIGLAAIVGCYYSMEENYLSFLQWVIISGVIIVGYLWYIIWLAYSNGR